MAASNAITPRRLILGAGIDLLLASKNLIVL